MIDALCCDGNGWASVRASPPALELAADTPTTPDTATLRAVADQLDHVIAKGEPEQAKALLAIPIAQARHPYLFSLAPRPGFLWPQAQSLTH
jgi:hypothetical protein